MFWRRKKLDYQILIPPLEKPFNLLRKAEAQDYFNWYMGKLDERVAYLKSVSTLDLDYSPSSLVPLWSWFLKNAEIEPTPQKQLESYDEQLRALKSPFRDLFIADHTTQLSLETEYMIMDIAMYFGQVFVYNYPSIFWGFYTSPKSDAFVNQPVLMGFPNQVCPEKKGIPLGVHHVVRMRALRLLNHDALAGDLLSIYQVWADKMVEFPLT